MESKLKHLEMIQGVINRMASNSFHLKGWSVTLISALFALAANDTNQLFIYLAYFPCVAFWSLDGYFLWQEKMYRKLYDETAERPKDKIDFNLNASQYKDDVDSIDRHFHEKPTLNMDLQETLHEALDQLPDIQKSVILLRDYEGYAYDEI